MDSVATISLACPVVCMTREISFAFVLINPGGTVSHFFSCTEKPGVVRERCVVRLSVWRPSYSASAYLTLRTVVHLRHYIGCIPSNIIAFEYVLTPGQQSRASKCGTGHGFSVSRALGRHGL